MQVFALHPQHPVIRRLHPPSQTVDTQHIHRQLTEPCLGQQSGYQEIGRGFILADWQHQLEIRTLNGNAVDTAIEQLPPLVTDIDIVQLHHQLVAVDIGARFHRIHSQAVETPFDFGSAQRLNAVTAQVALNLGSNETRKLPGGNAHQRCHQQREDQKTDGNFFHHPICALQHPGAP